MDGSAQRSPSAGGAGVSSRSGAHARGVAQGAPGMECGPGCRDRSRCPDPAPVYPWRACNFHHREVDGSGRTVSTGAIDKHGPPFPATLSSALGGRGEGIMKLVLSFDPRLLRNGALRAMIMAIFVTLNLLGTGTGEALHARGMRETRRTVDAIEIGEIDPASIPPGRYQGSFVAPLVSAVVEVSIDEGRIQSIQVLEHTHGPRYGAEAIVDSVLAAQSLQVDVISGATGSSKVMLKAIENALERR
ncbi:MAG: FMN-binding protein [Spirochaetaceae bacterium]|nr:MAG: FMN-binding protein [Spirochaetaceae bacterium]